MIPELIIDYLDNHNLTYRELADQISEQLGINDAITRTSIYYWIKGEFKPRPTLMAMIAKDGTGELQTLAQQILKELGKEPVQG
jgi:hypothetical protein